MKEIGSVATENAAFIITLNKSILCLHTNVHYTFIKNDTKKIKAKDLLTLLM